jgi:hypothetical protein
MDKLTPGQLHDLADLLFRNAAGPLTTWTMLKQEAARREGETVPKPVGSTCNQERRAAGLAYPRTCAKCGLGKCVGDFDSAATPPAADAQDDTGPLAGREPGVVLPDDLQPAPTSVHVDPALLLQGIEADAPDELVQRLRAGDFGGVRQAAADRIEAEHARGNRNAALFKYHSERADLLQNRVAELEAALRLFFGPISAETFDRARAALEGAANG